MIVTKYRGYSICQQKEFGPLRLLRWVEDGEFIIVKNDGNAMPGITFQTPQDAIHAIDVAEKFLTRRCS